MGKATVHRADCHFWCTALSQHLSLLDIPFLIFLQCRTAVCGASTWYSLRNLLKRALKTLQERAFSFPSKRRCFGRRFPFAVLYLIFIRNLLKRALKTLQERAFRFPSKRGCFGRRFLLGAFCTQCPSGRTKRGTYQRSYRMRVGWSCGPLY